MSSELVLARYRKDGSLDPGFGVDGMTITDFDRAWKGTSALLPLTDGAFLVGGNARKNGQVGFALARFDRHGVVDPSFGLHGIFVSNPVTVTVTAP